MDGDWIWIGPRLRYIVEAQQKISSQLGDLMREMENEFGLRTTVETSPIAPTQADQSDAAVTESTTPTPRTSSPLAPHGTQNGLAVHASWCVAPAWVTEFKVVSGGLINGIPCSAWLECPSCHASWLLVETPARDVLPTSSTFQKPDSSVSSATSARESEMSASPSSSEMCQHCNVVKSAHPYEYPFMHEFMPSRPRFMTRTKQGGVEL